MRDIRYYLMHALPSAQRRGVVRQWCRRRCGDAPLRYPLDLEHVRSLLMVLPEDVLESLYQVDNVLSIKEHFSQASVTFLCNSDVAEYYHSIAADASFVEYNTAERYLFSKVLAYHEAALTRERFQLCFLLETAPDLALLDLIGRCGAPVRAGYEHAAEYPFLNHVVRLPAQTGFLAHRYGALARSLGAQPARRSKLAVGRDAAEGVSLLLRDLRLDPSSTLLCIDSCGLERRYGRPWVEQLVVSLRDQTDAVLCVPAQHGTDERALGWLSERGATVVPPLTVPRLAALIARSALVVSGEGPVLRLAALLDRRAAGVLPAATMGIHVPDGGTVTGVAFEELPNADTIARVVAIARAAVPKAGGAEKSGKAT
jgi:ADP-heptose:LPS heptosyltransferase